MPALPFFPLAADFSPPLLLTTNLQGAAEPLSSPGRRERWRGARAASRGARSRGGRRSARPRAPPPGRAAWRRRGRSAPRRVALPRRRGADGLILRPRHHRSAAPLRGGGAGRRAVVGRRRGRIWDRGEGEGEWADRIWDRGEGGWVRGLGFFSRHKLHRWMGARWTTQVASNLVIRVKAVPRVSLASYLLFESQNFGHKTLISL